MEDLMEFTEYLFSKTYKTVFDPKKHMSFVLDAYEATLLDYRYHHNHTANQLLNLIKSNSGWLATYLYRLGNIMFNGSSQNELLKEIHWVMKEVCSCEIYYSIEIGQGLYVRHGEGTIIGSRCIIGKGFIIHQGCTIGHKLIMGDGPKIGDDVEMGVGSHILGNVTIGNNVIVAANAVVIDSVPEKSFVAGSPAKIKEKRK